MLPSAAHRCGAITGLGLAILLLMSLAMMTSALPTPMPQPVDVANANGQLLNAARHTGRVLVIDSAEQVKTPLTDDVKDTFKIAVAADHPDVHGPKKKGNHCPGYPNRNCPPPPPAEVATRVLVDDTKAATKVGKRVFARGKTLDATIEAEAQQHSVARNTFEYTGDASIEVAMLQVRGEPASPQYRGQMKKATALDVQRAVMQQLGESAVHLEGRGEANIANMEATE